MAEQEQQLISNQPLMNPFVFRVNDEKYELQVFGTYEKPWFIANELGNILGLTNIRENLKGLKPSYKNTVRISYGNRGNPNTTLINEAGMYSIIMKAHTSRNPIVQQFQDWVNEEVLPSIRQTGSYIMNSKIQQLEQEKKEFEEERKNFDHYKKNQSRHIIKNNRSLENGQHRQRIKLIDRLIDFHFERSHRTVKLTRSLYIHIMKDHKHYCRYCNDMHYTQHPGKYKIKGHLLRLSKLFANEHRRRNGMYPSIHNSTRSNWYTVADYAIYGDDVIEEYITRYPFETWGITWCEHLEPNQ